MSIENEMKELTAYEEEQYGDSWENIQSHGEFKEVIESLRQPLAYTVTLNIYGSVNNITVAAAIYEAFATTHKDLIDLYEVSNILQSQVRANARRRIDNLWGDHIQRLVIIRSELRNG